MRGIFPRDSFSLRATDDVWMTHTDRTDVKPSPADGKHAASARRSGADTDSGANPSPDADGTPRSASNAAGRRRRRAESTFADQVRHLLATQQIGCDIRAFAEVESTNSVAAEWIAAGAPHGGVVVADHQTHGRGRMGRSWIAAPGVNLTFSVILRPDVPADRFGMMTVAACVGVARCVDRFADPFRAAVKWPNDIYLNDRKVCGMLLEASWNAPGSPHAVVLGVGLNVNQEEFPDAISERATSLLLETGRIIPRADLLAALLSDIEKALIQLYLDDDALRREYVDKMTGVGEHVTLRFASSDRIAEGIVRGIDDSGGIVIVSDSGPRIFHAGEVTRSHV